MKMAEKEKKKGFFGKKFSIGGSGKDKTAAPNLELSETTSLFPRYGTKTTDNTRDIFIVVNSNETLVLTKLNRIWMRFCRKVKKRFKETVRETDLSYERIENVSGQGDKEQENLFKVSIPVSCLEYQAAIDGIKCELDYQYLNEWIGELHGKNIEEEDKVLRAAEQPTLFPSTHFIFVPVELRLKNFFVIDPRTGHFLSEIQQIWLLENIFDFTRMQGNSYIDSFFVSHNDGEDERIRFKSVCWFEAGDYTYNNFTKEKNPPERREKEGKVKAENLIGPPDVFDDIRGYYGEQVGLYFRFVTHIAKWSLPLAFLGLLCQAYIIYTLQVESPVVAVYCGAVIVWANMVTENWKRIEMDCALRWGMEGYERSEESRFQFEMSSSDAVDGYDPVEGKQTKLVNTKMFLLKCTFSYMVIFTMMFLVVATTITIYTIKSYLQNEFVDLGIPSQYSATCASVLNTVQIIVFKFIYTFIVGRLNDLENHRTETEYEDSMISKMTLFSFFNSYVSFFYIAFVAGSIPVVATDDAQGTNQCGLTGCMAMLSENLLIVLVTSLTADKFTEFVLPMFSIDAVMKLFSGKCCTDEEGIKDKLIDAYNRPTYDFTARLTDYTTLFVLFGYLVMFSPALPIAALFVAASVSFESRGDLMKLFRIYRRVIPQCAEDIGAWQGAFELITIVGVVSNSGLIVFTMGMFSAYTFQTQMWIFIGMQWLMFSLLSLGSHLIKDVPTKINIQRARTEYYTDVVPQIYAKDGK